MHSYNNNHPTPSNELTAAVAALIQELFEHQNGISCGGISENISPVVLHYVRDRWSSLTEGQREVANYIYNHSKAQHPGPSGLLITHLGWDHGEIRVLIEDILPSEQNR